MWQLASQPRFWVAVCLPLEGWGQDSRLGGTGDGSKWFHKQDVCR